MIGWKQAYTVNRDNIVLVKLDIPDTATVAEVRLSKPKRRFFICDKASIVDITSLDEKHRVTTATSMKDVAFKYTVGRDVVAKYDYTLGNQAGIYFFKTKKQALDYEY